MDEFVHRPKPFRSLAPKVDQVIPPVMPEQKVDKPVAPDEQQLPQPAPAEPVKAPIFVAKRTPKPLKQQTISDNNAFESIDLKLDNQPTSDKPAKQPSKRRISKKKLIIIFVVLALMLGAGAVYWFVLREKEEPIALNNNSTVQPTPTPTPKPISPLTGLELSSTDLAQRPVTGLMIENSYAARPQSGLLEAGIVFEAIAEGGITRFLALYQESKPDFIGPVRSIRPYYIDFAMGFDAAVGHVGGSPDALSDIHSLGMKDLDQFSNGDSYWRIDEREAPHNVYTSFERLDALNKSKSYTASTYTPFLRKKNVPQTPTANIIDLSISSPSYSPRFEYDVTTNSYKRSQDGTAHTDFKSGTQLQPKVVIAMVMARSLMSDGTHTVYQDTGNNKMFVFQDGIVSEGTWVKASRTDSFSLLDKNGLPMRLNTGQTWISIVDSESDVSYKL